MSPPNYQALLLVDGYNIIGAWSVLKRARDVEGLETARYHLIETLTNFSAFKGFDTRVVFDAYEQAAPTLREVVTSHVSVQYTGFGQTADTFIEKTCAQFQRSPKRFEQRLIVATSDRAQQLTVLGYGAECLSACQLAAEVDASRHLIQRRQRPRKGSSKRHLASSLDTNVLKQLTALRFGHTLPSPPQRNSKKNG